MNPEKTVDRFEVRERLEDKTSHPSSVMESSQKKQVQLEEKQARLTTIPIAEGSHLQNGAARDDTTESGKDGKVVASIDPEQLGG